MARLPRLALAGHVHWLIQRVHGGVHAFADDTDRQQYLSALQDSAREESVQVHAYALCDEAVHLLLTPAQASAPGRLMQRLGRRYVGAFHRRHGGSGTLWDGRFRSALVEPGSTLLEVMCLIDGLGQDSLHSSLVHRSSGGSTPWLLDPPDFWQLGNTPFERQGLWRQRVADGLAPPRLQALLAAAMGSWAVGSPAYVAQVAELAARPSAPRPRGRPKLTSV